MGLTKDLIAKALTRVAHPTGGTLATREAVKWVAACDAYASVRLYLGDGPDDRVSEDTIAEVAAKAEVAIRGAAAKAGEDVDALLIEFVNHAGDVIARAGEASAGEHAQGSAGDTPGQQPNQQSAQRPAQESASGLPGVRHIIAVGAGKGGVGKSTIAVNLAVGLAREGHAVGLLDGDIYGPSLPTLLGLDALEQIVHEGKLQPFAVHGIKAVSIGKMVEADKPLIWRGPMAHGAFNQLTNRTAWGELDYLIVDLPPGTGDVPLTLAQSLRLTGAVVVCTPQKVAQDDAVRAVRMFEQLGVDVLGVVENMSYFVADPDNEGNAKTYDIFGRGGAEMMAQRLGLPFLGAVPINMALRANSDAGEPGRNWDAEHAGGDDLPRALNSVVKQFIAQATLASMQQGASSPTLSIS